MFEIPENKAEYIRPFLESNGFVEEVPYVFIGDKCKLEIDIVDDVYHIRWRDKNNSQNLLTSENLNIYFLIGFLTYNGLIDRNFKIAQ